MTFCIAERASSSEKDGHKMKKIICGILALILTASILTGCEKGNKAVSNEDESLFSPIEEISFPDVSYTEAKSGEIIFNGDSISYSGKSATVNGSVVTIKKGGDYIVKGTLYNGQIVIEADDTEKVILHLDGVYMNSDNGPAIYCKKADRLTINLVFGTENVLMDGTSYKLPPGADEPDACVFSKSDMTIKGSGNLKVIGNYKKGIKTKDDIKIVAGNITIKSRDDSIVGRDSVTISGSTLVIESGADGVKTTNDAAAEKGYCSVEGGTISIKCENDGFDIVNDFTMSGGDLTIVSGGGFDSDHSITDASRKGIKAQTAVMINGGTITLDSRDDAINSSDIVVIYDGTIETKTGDDGINAANEITIINGKITVYNSDEGLESKEIILTGGDVDITSSDNGINATGTEETDKETTLLTIEGGTIKINAEGDGLDVNGSIRQTGGDIIIFGPTKEDDGAIDYDGSYDISGGSIFALGSRAMALGVSQSSSQCSALINLQSSQAANSILSITDLNGNEILTITAKKAYQSVVISSNSLTVGKTYKVMVNDSEITNFTQSVVNITEEK